MSEENPRKAESPYGKISNEGINLYNGDCLEVMNYLIAQNIKVDAIITDPPYGTTQCVWDSIIPLDEMWDRLRKLIKPNGAIVMTASQPFTSKLVMSNLDMYKYNWVWESNRAANFAQAPYMALKNCEDVLVFSFGGVAHNAKPRMIYNPQGTFSVSRVCAGKKPNDHRPAKKTQAPYKQTVSGYPNQILKFAKETGTWHPTQKPVKLMEYLIKTYTNEGDTVLDFTSGSFTTGVAAVQTGRKFIGIELNETYFELGKKRVLEAMGREPESDPNAEPPDLGILEMFLGSND